MTKFRVTVTETEKYVVEVEAYDYLAAMDKAGIILDLADRKEIYHYDSDASMEVDEIFD